jgi:DNA-binding Lrp family transcriptional regulator
MEVNVLRATDDEIIDYIKKHSRCNRKELCNSIYEENRGIRKLFSTKLAQSITRLEKNGILLETEIKQGKGNKIKNSKLSVISGDQKEIHPKMGKNEKQFSQNEIKLKTISLDDTDKKILRTLDSEKNLTTLQKELNIPTQTMLRRLHKLRKYGYVNQKSKNKNWKLTSYGEGKVEKELIEKYVPDDALFLQLPFLVQSGESFTPDKLVHRANAFLGFYYQHGFTDDEAHEHFRKKILNILNSPLVSSYIRKEHFIWKVVCSEETLLLWRLYSLLNTVLYKSEKRRIGFGTIMYEELIGFLQNKFRSIEMKIKELPEHEQYMIWLLYNGVQLETIKPKMEIINNKGVDLRDTLKRMGIPLKIYNEGKENETTLIEEED